MLRPRTRTQTSVGVSQVLSSRFGIRLSASTAAHTSTETPREPQEVSVLSEEYVCAEDLVGDRITANSFVSFRFILVIHHLRPRMNDAGRFKLVFGGNFDVQTRMIQLLI